MPERGIEISHENPFETNTQYKSGVADGQRIAMSHRRFTAVAVMSDIVAFGVMEGLRLCGRNVPGDVSVIGFDDLPECQYSNPKLSTISQNAERNAQRVGERLFRQIWDGEVSGVSERLDAELVERQSVKDLNL